MLSSLVLLLIFFRFHAELNILASQATDRANLAFLSVVIDPHDIDRIDGRWYLDLSIFSSLAII